MKMYSLVFVVFSAASAALPAQVVSFKDAAKIKSWDAWDDHLKKKGWKEKPCVTWKSLNELKPGLKEIGRLAVRDAKDIKSSNWSIGCETMDRDYADWNAYKSFLAPLGVKHGRLFSGWAKTEQEKGKYDFTWLDPQVREMAAMGIRPWICLSYGNPVYGSDFRLGMRVKQVTENPEAFEAWLRYCTACVERYKDVVDEWEVWNEPFGQGAEYAELYLRTARAIRAVQPEAKIRVTAMIFPGDYRKVLDRVRNENALDLVSRVMYHPYHDNPDKSYAILAEPLRRLVKSYSGSIDVMQGEVGCPAQLEFAHALNKIEWTEYSQAKWNLRRAVGDAVRAIPSNVFTMIDLQYTFMLQSFGMLRSNTLKEVVYRRPSYFAMQNIFSYLDDEAVPYGVVTNAGFTITRRADPRDTAARRLTCARFTRFGRAVRFYWFSDSRPSNRLDVARVTLEIPGRIVRPVWVEMITGRIFEFDAGNVRYQNGKTVLTDVPMWDSPVMIAEYVSAPRRYDWKNETPYDIVDSFYKPGETGPMKALPPPGSQPWMKMKTEDFLPCIDRYGQFKHRQWPGKTVSDADLKAAAEEEKADLAAHPGPADRNRYGGWAAGPQLKATGRFRTEKIDGRWWLVDPDGRLFWSFGPVRVTASSGMTPMNGDTFSRRRGCPIPDRDILFEELPPAPDAPGATPFSKFWTTHDRLLLPFFHARGETRIYDFTSSNLYRKYGEDYYAVFSDLVHRRLRSWGANTIANSSDKEICLMDRTPFAERVECQSRSIAASSGMWWKFRDPWDASFSEGVTEALKKHDRSAHDRWCIGFFVDNEINWGGYPAQLAEWTLQSPADQPAKAACVAFLKKKYGDIESLNGAWNSSYSDWSDLLHATLRPGSGAKADLEAFTAVIVDEYFKRTRAAVKAFDRDLLYLGCRFAGSARPWVIGPCAKYCDVVSYNIYAEEIGGWRLPQNLDAPVLIGEFHFGATDRGPFGTGVRQAKDQNDRAQKLKRYVRSALANPQIVGVHWHQFADQATSGRFCGEGLQVGWTDICDRPYPETVAAVREVGYGLYNVRFEGR